jgi:hypothetical protein
MRAGALDDYLAWVRDDVRAAAEAAGWRALMWLGAIHSSEAFVYLAAPSWDALPALADALPDPDPAWRVGVESSALAPWDQSGYLMRR